MNTNNPPGDLIIAGISVAMNDRGDFIVAWGAGDTSAGTSFIRANIFSHTGASTGEYAVNTNSYGTFPDIAPQGYLTQGLFHPAAAIDRFGATFVAWHAGGIREEEGIMYGGIIGQKFAPPTPDSESSPWWVPGDFDGDGDVDGADFIIWQTNFPTQSGATVYEGDADGDGDVDGADFIIWQTNFPYAPWSW